MAAANSLVASHRGAKVSLPAGSRLGPYEVVAPIGAGGMGEVYRAKDARLGRDVAIKVLPASLSDDPDRLKRFEQEARAAGVLNHPNVTIVYDIGQQDGAPYVVQELLEGETLRAELSGGRFSPRKAIDYGIQIAQGLAAAHEKGIVHRDLKPENLFVTNDGRVKILDFGLAKLTQVESSGQTTNLPTATEPGVVMGTLGYMSPEQIKAKPADARSDIFALGAILFEMLSGQRAFRGDSAGETMASILKEDPPELSVTNKNVSPGLERLVRHCLEKNPERRFQSVSDVAFDLEALSGVPVAAGEAAGGQRIRRQWFVAAGLLGALGLGTWIGRGTRPPALDSRPVRSTILLPERVSFGSAALSPNGAFLAIAGIDAGGRRGLWLRSLRSDSTTFVAGSENGALPFWSPDSRSIGFFAGGKLMRIEAAGGPPVPLADSLGVGACWGPGGDILYTLATGPVYRLPASGGKAVAVTALDQSRHESSHRYPQFLPDGRHFLYVALDLAAGPSEDANRVYVASLDSKEVRPIMHAYSRTLYSNGYLLYSRGGDLFGPLMAQPFDSQHFETRGDPLTLAERVHVFDDYYLYTNMTASQSGVLVYESELLLSRFVWFDRAGRQIGEFGEPAIRGEPRLSPDGLRVAFTLYQPSGASQIWIGDLSRGVQTRLTQSAASHKFPVWSPDGGRIAYQSNQLHQGDLYVIATNGSGQEEPLHEAPGVRNPDDWSPDGRFIAENSILAEGDRVATVSILPLSGDRKSTVLVRDTVRGLIFGQSRFSSDGKWLAYTSEESGRPEVYVTSFPGRETTLQVSNAGGVMPSWRRDGSELFYLSPGGLLMSVGVEKAPRFALAAPKPLFRLPGNTIFGTASLYDVTPDGSRFLASVPVVHGSSWPLNLVVNWPELLTGTK